MDRSVGSVGPLVCVVYPFAGWGLWEQLVYLELFNGSIDWSAYSISTGIIHHRRWVARIPSYE